MDEKLASKINYLIQKAKESPKKSKATTVRNRSSLHKIIKTKEQADLFMKLLKSA